MSDDEERIDVESEDVHDRSNAQLSSHLHADKRAHHNALERKRRDHIKDSFHHLRDTVPHLEGEKISRAQILNKATDFIKEMRHSTASSEADIEELRRSNIILEEKVKALEDVKSNGNACDDEVDTVLANAEKRALEKLNNASKVPSRALPHGQLIGGMAGPHDMKPITGSGLVLNALATSRGLSQLVNSVTPSDHSYTSPVSGLPGASTANFKPELTSSQPSVIKNSVRSSLVALSSSLRSGGPTSLSLSTSTTGGAQVQTRSAVPLAVGVQAKLPSAALRGVSQVIVKAPPAVASSSLPRGIVTATAVPPVAQPSALTVASSADQKQTSAATASSLLPQSNASYSTAAASSTLPQPSSSAGKSSSSNVLQTLLSANPLELNSALQNLLLTAANSSTSSLTEAQKTLINTLVAITSTSNPGGSADGVAGPGGSAGGLLCTQQRPQSSEGGATVGKTQTGAEADKVMVPTSPVEGEGPSLDPQDLLSTTPLSCPSQQSVEEEVDVLGEEGDLPPTKRAKQV